MTAAQIAPAILVPLVLWRIYVRAQHNLGRQQLHLGRLRLRIALCALFGVGITFLAAAQPTSLRAALGGMLAGTLLAVSGLKVTRWEMTPAGSFFTPSPVLGVGLTMALLGDLVYRSAVLLDRAAPLERGVIRIFETPFTLALAGLAVGYHFTYAVGVLLRGRRVA